MDVNEDEETLVLVTVELVDVFDVEDTIFVEVIVEVNVEVSVIVIVIVGVEVSELVTVEGCVLVAVDDIVLVCDVVSVETPVNDCVDVGVKVAVEVTVEDSVEVSIAVCVLVCVVVGILVVAGSVDINLGDMFMLHDVICPALSWTLIIMSCGRPMRNSTLPGDLKKKKVKCLNTEFLYRQYKERQRDFKGLVSVGQLLSEKVTLGKMVSV